MIDPNFASATIRKYSHNFAIFNPTWSVLNAIHQLEKNLIQWKFEKEFGRYIRKPKDRYYVKMQGGRIWRFHINIYDTFIEECSKAGVKLDTLIIHESQDYQTTDVEHCHNGIKSVMDKQREFVEYLSSPEPRHKLVEARTGFGKTFMTAYSSVKHRTRIVYIILPKYIAKTIGDLKEEFHLSNDDICVVDAENGGLNRLKQVIALGKEGKLKAKFIIISLVIYATWLNKYIIHGAALKDDGWLCSPVNFFETVDSNQLIIDECHEFFHSVFFITLFTHVRISIFMSATLEDKDKFITDMYEIMFPHKNRISKGEFKKYMKATCVYYDFAQPQYIRVTEFGNTSYSHVAFERSILKNKFVRENYAKFVIWCIEQNWIKLEHPKVLLLYFATTNMIEFILKKLTAQYKDLKIVKKIHGSPIKPVHSSDIVISTIGSLGTGHDIKNLKEVHMHVNRDSIKSNKQGWGRLREQADGNHRLIFMIARQFPKAMTYDAEKRKLLSKEATCIDTAFYIDKI